MEKSFKFVGLMLMAVMSIGFISCGSDDDDNEPSISVTPSSVVMHFDETKQLNVKGTTATSWTVEDDFIASVEQTGLVNGRHVGSTKIRVSDGKKSAFCDVTITPKYSLIDTPILNWGTSKSSVESSETHSSLSSSSSDYLMYDYTLGSTACIIMYGFENNKLETVMAVLNRSLFVTAGYYLMERYQPVYVGDDDQYLFIDAMTEPKAKTVVMLSFQKIDGSNVTAILYTDKNKLSSTPAMMKSPEIPKVMFEQIKNILK